MPESIPLLGKDFFEEIARYDLGKIALEVAKLYLNDDFESDEIAEITSSAITFPAPLVRLTKNISVLELWHGPTLAFKDFGARFMAQVMTRLLKDDERITILVATSGDTGGAVASGFHGLMNIDVVVLYPRGKVSELQEKQLTTLGQNITAIEVAGNFDDCQKLVKTAFRDNELSSIMQLSSANSINIARLLPQTFYYFDAYRQLGLSGQEIVFAVPSGNFGNLMAGLIAKEMGLPAKIFVAATNANDVVPSYLKSGSYAPTKSIQTISNAMDVGDPSNFERILDLHQGNWNSISEQITGHGFDDERTKEKISEVYTSHQYVIDPHGAVGMLGAEAYLEEHKDDHVVVLETAHPSKFMPVMSDVLDVPIDIPTRLAKLRSLKKEAISLDPNYEDFKAWLITHAGKQS